MRPSAKSQIELLKLIFTVSWEDPACDDAALRIKPGETVMCVTSGGCNTLDFLLKDPRAVYAVDINPSQSYVLELKIAAMQQLGHRDFLRFAGILPSSDRIGTYRLVKNGLSTPASLFWDYHHSIIGDGFLFQGKYDQFVSVIGKLITFIQRQKHVNGLLDCSTLSDQQAYYEHNWENWKTRAIFNLFYNKHVLGKIGLKTDYFHFAAGSDSFSRSFLAKFKRAACTIPITGNYFFHVYLTGRYRSLTEVPEYLREEQYEVIKSRLDRISVVTHDVKKWLAGQPNDSIDCFALSNICELMSIEDTHETFSQVARKAANGARICFRNLIIPRSVPEDLQHMIRRDDILSDTLVHNDRSFVYSRVDALTVHK